MTVRSDLTNTHRNHTNITPLAYTLGVPSGTLYRYPRTSVCGVMELDEDIENRYDYAMDEFGNLENRTGTNNNGVVFETRDLPADPSTNRLEGKFYDILGNLKQTTNEDGIDSILVYMDQGHVHEVVDPDTDNTLFRYYYDAGGQRRIKARGESSDGIMDNASFSFYEGHNLICQLVQECHRCQAFLTYSFKTIYGRVNLFGQGGMGDQLQYNNDYNSKFLLLDHLGTTRAELKFEEDFDTGEITPTIATGYDYMPYGELITEDHLIESLPGNPDPRTEQVLFTGKPRDKESGLDDFGPRKYSSMLAQWMSPDIIFIDNDIFNPQSWNLYSYVRGNPVVFLDPNGQYAFDSNATEALCQVKKAQFLLLIMIIGMRLVPIIQVFWLARVEVVED